MKYIAYVRKSTDDKKHQVQSLPNQLDWVKKTAKDLDIELIKIFTDKKTAKEPGREGFNSMMEYIYKNPEPLGVLCWKMNRLSRNPVDAGSISYALMQQKIKHIYAIDRQFREGDNQILLGVEFGAATQYSIDLASSVIFGMNKKLEKGYRPTLAPLGYINDGGTVSGMRKIYKDPERFDVLKNAWEKFLTGAYSVEMIRKELNRSGFTNRKGKPLVKSYLYKMFTNTFYAGYYTWQEKTYEGKHPKMITPAEFSHVQEILNKKNSTRPYKNDQLFSGIVTCRECGYGVTSEDHTKTIKATGKIKTYVYLRCTKKNPLIKCQQKYLSLTKAEKQVKEKLTALQLPEEFLPWFCELFAEQQKESNQKLGHKKATLQKKINENKDMMQRLIDNLNRGVVDDELYAENMNRYKEKDIQLKQQFTKLEADNGDWIEQLKKDFYFANSALEQYNNGTKNTKREILTRIGSNWILNDKKLLVDLLPPFVLFNKIRIFCNGKNPSLELFLLYSRSRKSGFLTTHFPEWWSSWEEVRTFYLGL